MENKIPYFDRNMTNTIKGIAIIFMLVHHFFTFPEWYVQGISYPQLQTFARIFCGPFRLCVPMFAFLTGYFYGIVYPQNIKYSLKKIGDIFIAYWWVYLPYLLIAIITGNFDISNLRGIVLEIFALKTPIMIFCWYVVFYSISMLILPVLSRVMIQNVMQGIGFGIILPTVICTLGCRMVPANSIMYGILSDVRFWFPLIGCGFLFSRFSLFQRIYDKIFGNIKYEVIKLSIAVIIIAVSFVGEYVSPNFSLGEMSFFQDSVVFTYKMSLFYIPTMIWGFITILSKLSDKGITRRLLQTFGKYSLLIWFLHGIFFNVCKNIFQPILFFPRNPILVFVWGAGICLGAAMIWDIPIRKSKELLNVLYNKCKRCTAVSQDQCLK